MAVLGGQVFPLVYALLTSKTTMAYTRLFHRLLHLLTVRGLQLQQGLILISDFETSLIPAVLNCLPLVCHRGCYFHFGQCIYRNVLKLGLSVRYREDNEFKTRIRMFIALGLVPIQHVDYFSQIILQTYAADPELHFFYTNYFSRQWLFNDSIPRYMWNWYGVHYRTNNNVESNNSKLSKLFPVAHPNCYRFLSIMKTSFCDSMIDARARELGAPLPPRNSVYFNLNNKLIEVQHSFFNLHPIDYLRQIAHVLPKPLDSIRL